MWIYEPRAEVIFADHVAACLNENSRVLDVGCGHGEFTNMFAGRAKEVVGIDVIEGYIKKVIRGGMAYEGDYLCK